MSRHRASRQRFHFVYDPYAIAFMVAAFLMLLGVAALAGGW